MSPVFTAMLETDMKEAALGRIKVEDAGPAPVERMLGYIYSGKLFLEQDKNEELSNSLITELLHCAEKYEITEMKQEVIGQMMSQLAVTNAIMFLNAAELYGAGEGVQMEIMEFCKKWVYYFLHKVYIQLKVKIP